MIRLSKSSITDEEVAAVAAVLREEYLGLGPHVQAFEKELNAFFGAVDNVVCAVNGTAALQLALQAVGVKAGDEVLVPTLTYLASFQAISAIGAIPVACEVNDSDGLLNIDDVKNRITKKTKAIMPVHYAGNAGDLDAILHLAKEHGLRVVEDAAHAFGTRYKNKLIGGFGDVVCFSFDGIKNITCGEGGAIVTGDNAVIQQVKDLRLLGVMKDSDKRYARARSWDFDVVDQGWRYHMSDIMAAIGRVQLKRFPTEFKPKRMSFSSLYREKLKSIPNIKLLDIDEHNEVVPHIMPIRVLNGKRDGLREYLLAQDMQVGIHYKPNHLLTKYARPNVKLPVAEKMYSELMTLPLHVDLTPDMIEQIVKHIDTFMRK
jgi:dTDP-4-amino-4,6-dideoxygalactose transaminase